MKTQLALVKAIKIIVAIGITGSAMLSSEAALATPVSYTFGDFLQNGNFEAGGAGISGWQTNPIGTSAINVRNATDAINITTGNAGFAVSNSGPGTSGTAQATGTGFFNSRFAVLGDQSGVIGGDTTTGTYKLYQDFELLTSYNGHYVLSYDINFNFDSVFDGRDSQSTSSSFSDIFTVTLISLDDGSETSLTDPANSNSLPNLCLGNATTCPNTNTFHQIENHANTDVFNLLPGSYRLEFKLAETNGNPPNFTDTAVGIDNVMSSGTAHVPEPASFALMGLGFAYLTAARRSKSFTLTAQA